MPPLARGAAVVDRSGAVLAADRGFLEALEVHAGDGGLSARAEADPALRSLVAGAGPDVATVGRSTGEPLRVERVGIAGGWLLVVRAPGDPVRLEHAARSEALSRLAAGLAHDVKNPLNAMALQIALLHEKLAGVGGADPSMGGHLAALREQIGRVNEVVRRFLDVADPSAPLGYTDVGALVADTGSLLGHEARRRGIALAFEAAAGAARTRCEPGRTGRLVLGLLSRALAETPDGGRLAARAAGQGHEVRVVIEHATGDPDPDLGYDCGVAADTASALGGSLSFAREGGVERILLALPRDEHE